MGNIEEITISLPIEQAREAVIGMHYHKLNLINKIRTKELGNEEKRELKDSFNNIDIAINSLNETITRQELLIKFT